jgi:hypothetical protein
MTHPLAVSSAPTNGRTYSTRLLANVFLAAALVCVSCAAMLAQNPSEFPLYPKYQVMGVV